MNSHPYYLSSVLMISVLFYGTLMSFSTFLCYKYLRQKSYMLTAKTLSLFRNLMNMLLLELCIGFVLGTIMTIIIGISLLTNAQSGSLIMLFVMTIMELYPFGSHLIVIIYVETYRQGVVKLLHLTRFNQSSTTTIQPANLV
jgi:hypothetical protein